MVPTTISSHRRRKKERKSLGKKEKEGKNRSEKSFEKEITKRAKKGTPIQGLCQKRVCTPKPREEKSAVYSQICFIFAQKGGNPYNTSKFFCLL